MILWKYETFAILVFRAQLRFVSTGHWADVLEITAFSDFVPQRLAIFYKWFNLQFYLVHLKTCIVTSYKINSCVIVTIDVTYLWQCDTRHCQVWCATTEKDQLA